MDKNYGVSMLTNYIQRVDGNIEISLESVGDDAIGLLIYSGNVGYTAAIYNIVN